MQGRHRLVNASRHQRGVGLIEVMIAVLVLGVGLLGVAALQATALRNSQSALERSQAVIQSYSIFDAMRANRVNAIKGDYVQVMDTACAVPAAAVPVPPAPPVALALAKQDIADWRNSIKAALGDGACGSIAQSGNDMTVTIQWDDSRGTGGQSAQTLITRTQL